MDTIKKIPLKDPVYITGLILIFFSVTTFMLPEITAAFKNSDSFGIFIFNYLLFIIYLLTLFINSLLKFRWRIYKNNIEYTFLLLILGLISAYSLNREMNLFSESTTWLCIYLCMLAFTLILLAFKDQLPYILKHFIYFLLGVSVVLCLYLAVYLFPLYIFSAIVLFILGISGHIFVPLGILLYSLIFLRSTYASDKKIIISFLTGMSIPLIITVCFIINWNNLSREITYTYNESVTKNNKLPNWIKVSQKLSDDWITDRVIKSGLVYSSPKNEFKLFRTPGEGRDPGIKHDPLVMCAAFLCGKPELEESEKTKILEAVYDARHQSEDRLWSGADLHTSNVITNTEIYPDLRIAYTEKIISIHNSTPENQRWGNVQEAIYSFHLPEGSVVTSLSLWINGKEEKGSLTTKSNADYAYKTIVGIESRDPSVLHWKEGNIITVRVFPCTQKENRRFKIGITSPLKKTNDSLIYPDIAFEGPEYGNATESANIQFRGEPVSLKMPSYFKMSEKNYFRYDGDYHPFWEIKMKAGAVRQNVFSFMDKNFSIDPYNKKYETFSPEVFYLDINKSWTEEEVKEVRLLAGGKDVYVYKDALIKLNSENFDNTVSQLMDLKFSLFPINKIKDPSKSLLITKNHERSPNLHDLEGSDFIKELNLYFLQKTRVRLFDLGPQLSPYLKSLKEMRVFYYDQGSMDDMTRLIKENRFLVNVEDENNVVIDNASIIIKQASGGKISNGPDHILRLFAYNDIMRKLNTNYLHKEFFSIDLINEAKMANVVSPVSSLIVLETQKDYDRFGIQKENGQPVDNNSLHNASNGSFGSVPEPHEWLLIILCVAVVSFFFIKPYLEKRFTA